MNRTHFPMFVDISEKKVVIIGGGKIAERRFFTLKSFGADIMIVSPALTDRLKKETVGAEYICGEYKAEYIIGAYMVLACTDNREVNARVGRDAKKQNIPVSVCDSKDECSFYFPGVILTDEVTVGVCGDGNGHRAVKRAADRIRTLFKGGIE